MIPALTDLLATGSGALVGLALGLLGGGGSILAAPLLVYIVGVKSPHVAIGTSAVAVSVSAFGNLIAHWGAGRVKWRCALVFAASGVVGALAGSSAGKALDGEKLMALFGIIMVVVSATMFRRRGGDGDSTVRLTRATAARLLPRLVTVGFGVGLLSGFFGIGGGFLIVPGLMLGSGMPILNAIGSSLFSVGSFGLTTAINYALSGLIEWTIALLFILGGLAGGFLGMRLAIRLAAERRMLTFVFVGIIFAVAIYMLARTGLPPWLSIH